MGGFKSFLNGAKNVRGWIEVDIEGFGDMEDGVSPKFRCLPFGNADWLDPAYGEYRGIPVLSGGKKELEEDDAANFVRFAIQLLIKSVRFSREITEEGKVEWQPARIVKDDEKIEPWLEGDVLMVPLRYIDIAHNIVNMAAALIKDSNQGGRMAEVAPAEGFRGEGSGENGAPSEEDKGDAPRTLAQPKRRTRRVG